MLPGMCSPDLGLNVVDGVRALSLKGDGLAGAVQVAPARVLPGEVQLAFCSLFFEYLSW